MKTTGHWKAGTLYILGTSIVGTISQGASGNWYAYGCMSGWEDVPLGAHETREIARERVERWVRERIEEEANA